VTGSSAVAKPGLDPRPHEPAGAVQGRTPLLTVRRGPASLRTTLAEYIAWVPGPVPAPVPANRRETARGLADIVRVEGPVHEGRVFELYAAAAGVSANSPDVRLCLKHALAEAQIEDLVTELEGFGVVSAPSGFLDRPGPRWSPPRVLGPRALWQVHPGELHAAFGLVSGSRRPRLSWQVLRETLDAMGYAGELEFAIRLLYQPQYSVVLTAIDAGPRHRHTPSAEPQSACPIERAQLLSNEIARALREARTQRWPQDDHP